MLIILMCAVLVLPSFACSKTKETEHVHQWSEADCVSPKKCDLCGETQGKALGHKWEEAKCDSPKTCSVCGETEGAALGHKWDEATCTSPKTCSVCGATEGDALGHKWVEATCDTPKTCSVCGETEGEKLGHKVDVWELVKDATCAEEGSEKGVCMRCGKEQTRTLDLLAHDFGDWKTTEKASCTQEGKEVRVCKVCGAEEESKIDKLDHVESDWSIEEEATYTDSGVRVKKCKVCGEELVRETYSLAKDEKSQWLRKNCKTGLYKSLERTPDDYEGEYVKFTCKVLQVCYEATSSSEYSQYRMATSGSYDNVIYAVIDNYGAKSRILEDDKITVYGISGGLYSYTTVRGDKVTIPLVYVIEWE